MSWKTKILGASYDKKVVRQRSPKADLWDKAAEIEDSETGETKWKLKSDGREIPKPEQDKVGYLFYRKWWHKLLFMPKKRVEYAIFEDGGEDQGTFKDPHSTSLEGGQDHGIFQTHRNLQGKKYVELYSKDDNTQLWIAGYLTVLALMTFGGIWMVVQGTENAVADAVAKGIKGGVKAGQSASGTDVPGVSIIPVIGFLTREKLSQLKGLGK